MYRDKPSVPAVHKELKRPICFPNVASRPVPSCLAPSYPRFIFASLYLVSADLLPRSFKIRGESHYSQSDKISTRK